MLPGKSMVLLRSGMSDMVDIITCLCLYAVEAGKIRSRMHDPNSITLLEERLREKDNVETARDVELLLTKLEFTTGEISGMQSLWPGRVLRTLSEIIRHRESINIDFRRHVPTFHIHRSQNWTHQVADAARTLSGFEPADLDPDIPVHIISSNDHSVLNCLSPDFRNHEQEILAWAEEAGHPLLAADWPNRSDLVYALGPHFWRTHPGKKRCDELSCGILRLKDTSSTGIQVQLIDTTKLDPAGLDPAVRSGSSTAGGLIVNIDYAFGEQAEDIIRNLILLFGRNLASINVLGKAGSLVGKRGDILIPDAFIEQTSDRFYPLEVADSTLQERLEQQAPGSSVHTGPILTVAGTLMQNRQMLNFYRHIWNCIGLEMEGTFYYRQILEAMELNVIPRQIPSRFLYYVSDLPLGHRSSLSSRLHPSEGIPPLYCVTREILSAILG